MNSKKSSFLNNDPFQTDYYNNDNFVSSSITEHDIKYEDKFPFSKYVIYKVDLSTSVKSWSVWKRYSNFEEFREIMKLKIIHLPELPEKKLFNTSKNTIQNRKLSLTSFLNFFLAKEKLLCNPEIAEFIELDKETIALLLNKVNIEVTSNSLKNNISGIDTSDINNKKLIMNNYYSHFVDYALGDTQTKSAFMQLCEEFLKNLELKPQVKSSIVKNFDNFMKTHKSWPCFKTDEIQKLLFGEFDSITEEYTLRGLLAHIGDISENSYGAEECLFFLIKLIDCEYNPEHEKYISILKQMTLDHFESLNLILHLDSGKSNVRSAVFILLDIINSDKKSKFDKYLIQSGIMKYYEVYVANKEE